MTMADRIAVMRDGRIDQMGSAEDLYDRPRTEFVANFLGSSNLIDARLVARHGDVAELAAGGATLRAPSGLVEGQSGALRIGVRPEKLTLRPAEAAAQPPDGENALLGHVTDASFVGVSTHYIVRTDGGHDIQVFAQNTGGGLETLGPGRRVSASWQPEHTFVVAKEEAGA